MLIEDLAIEVWRLRYDGSRARFSICFLRCHAAYMTPKLCQLPTFRKVGGKTE
jgi:hypothetical protein